MGFDAEIFANDVLLNKIFLHSHGKSSSGTCCLLHTTLSNFTLLGPNTCTIFHV